MAVNESWRLCTWADVLYGCDGLWWKQSCGVPEFKGLKISQDAEACARYADVHHVTVQSPESVELLVDEPGIIGAGGNSGFQAINLAVQFGVTRIGLVGFDMHVANGLHWHGAHANGLNNPREISFIKWRRVIDGAASRLREFGVDVVNASPESALMAFPKMTIGEALARWGLD